MIWQVALLLVAVTFMIVNLWTIYYNMKMLKKIAPIWDKMMIIADKGISYYEKEVDELIEEE